MACRPAGESHVRFKAINSRTGEGQPSRCPFLIGSGNGRRYARSCFAHRPVAPLRSRRLDFGVRYFGFGLFCARCRRRPRHSPEVPGADMGQLILKSANASRSSGEWSDDDVLAEGIVVGRIMKAAAAALLARVEA